MAPTEVNKPFERTIEKLKQIQNLDAPMSKLELMYNCCTQEIVKETSAFWHGFDIPDRKLAIDVDQL